MEKIILRYDANGGNRSPRCEINVSFNEAIDMLTIIEAWMANYEDSRGCIEVGKYAVLLLHFIPHFIVILD